jgi:carboxypeptidase family protein
MSARHAPDRLRELVMGLLRHGGMQIRRVGPRWWGGVPCFALAASGIALAGILVACSPSVGASGAVADATAAARAALTQNPRFAGIGPYDAKLVGQASWYKVVEGGSGWTVTIRMGWGDCPAGCINEHIWTYAVDRGGQVTATGERGDPLPNARPVTGRATAGPTCPVMRNPPDPGCSDRPVAGAVLVIQSAAGVEVARVTTDRDGRFTLTLAPGAYRLVPEAVTGVMGTAAPIPFEVAAGLATPPLQVSYDTGIR